MARNVTTEFDIAQVAVDARRVLTANRQRGVSAWDARAYDFVSLLCAGEPLGRVIEAAPEQAPMLLAQQLGKGRLSAFTIAQ